MVRFVTDVPGFRAAGVHAGLKPHGALDVALVVSERPCVAAATFTQNVVKAAPVLYDQALLAGNRTAIWAVVINSKNANAVTGPQGLRDAERMAELTAEVLALPPGAGVFVMSTGVIGVPLPMNKVERGIRLAAQSLSPNGGADAARAIMTTDTRPKHAGLTVDVAGARVTVAGMGKGAGMIHPDMATMLAVITTDVAITPQALDVALRYAVERSFNCITVDGDTSTNDTCLVLANGLAGHEPIQQAGGHAFITFRDALTAVCQDLARQIAFDGEGATKRVTITVSNAGSFEAARQVGRTIATSPLVKTALFGNDANWGRVLAAAGRAGVSFDPTRTTLWFGELQVLHRGLPVPFDERRALDILSRPDISITLDLGGPPGQATVWTCDLSHEYVTINAEYRT
ncbi:MAG: bifunctional glutamate N-acetyltransferase/amino-acid acetyltransferase ArgJ [Ardenticatenia bacterium]|nr:bifunctional glutamate N-acetyltransferase/amino-acid acetyltransferase ArgJ [Ardenticatenia bacterium]